jgi:tetratricopeptide (TPR) repeat protein
VDALTHFQRALELDPEFHIARANLGALYVEMKQWTNALEILGPLLHESRYDTPYLVENNLGWIYFNLKDYGEAERHYRRAILLNDKMCLAYNNLGILRFATERFEEAEDAFSAAIKRCPEFVEAHFRSGTVLERLGRYPEASKVFKKCEKLGGESLYGRRCKQKLQVMR